MSHLVPCTACARHVRATETSCPFCGAEVRRSAPPRLPTERLGRAARFAFGAAVVTTTLVAPTLGVAGCNESHAPGDDGGASELDAGIDAAILVEAGTPVDAGVDPVVDAGLDSGAIAPPYGAPAEDAGSGVPLYGAPPAD